MTIYPLVQCSVKLHHKVRYHDAPNHSYRVISIQQSNALAIDYSLMSCFCGQYDRDCHFQCIVMIPNVLDRKKPCNFLDCDDTQILLDSITMYNRSITPKLISSSSTLPLEQRPLLDGPLRSSNSLPSYPLVMTHSSPWKDPPFLIGKPR